MITSRRRTSIGVAGLIRASGVAKCGGAAVSEARTNLAANSASTRARKRMKMRITLTLKMKIRN